MCASAGGCDRLLVNQTSWWAAVLVSSLSLLVFNLPVLPVSGAGVEISAQGHESARSLFLCLLPALGSSAASTHTLQRGRATNELGLLSS